jgi:dihydroflavonol-4-reductase
MYFTHAKATEALGYRPRPARQGLEDAIAWFRKEGYLS